jgi:hypothetical protein
MGARRRYRAAFISKIDEALGEATETQSWLDDALDRGYITSDQFKKMDDDWSGITSMLARMIDRSADFCKYSSDTGLSRNRKRRTAKGRRFVFRRVERTNALATNHFSRLTSHFSRFRVAPQDSLMMSFKASLHLRVPTRRPSSSSKAANAACSPCTMGCVLTVVSGGWQ